jgi:hypothetical protein
MFEILLQISAETDASQKPFDHWQGVKTMLNFEVNNREYGFQELIEPVKYSFCAHIEY